MAQIKVTHNIENSQITLDAAEIPNLDAAKITTGTLANARIAEASVTQHVTATDLQPLKSDLSALALREATNESSAAFNLPNQFIDTFTDDTNLGTQTTVDRTNGYITSIIPGTGNDANTVVMLHMDNNITDSSTNNITFTNFNTVTFASGTKKFGTHSALFVQANDEYLGTGDLSSGLTNAFPTTGDFTVDYWLAYVSRSASNRHFGIGQGATPSVATEPKLTVSINAGGSSANVNAHAPPSAGTWSTDQSFAISAPWTGFRHYAYQRTGTTSYMWIDGTPLVNSASSSTHLSGDNLMSNSNNLFIGTRGNTSSEFLDAYIDEFRISNTSRYTGGSSFTPATTAYTAEVVNATGTLIQSANTVASAKTKVGGTMLYKDNAGTATLGTDLKIYFSCNNGGAWTEAASYNAITPVYSTGIKQVRLGETTCTSGTGVIYKAVWANQSASKETQLHGIGLNY